MKLKYKEAPKEWRKSALLTLFGLGFISSLLRWRHVFTPHIWDSVIVILVVIAICASLRPRWFRGYYRLSMRLGFFVSQFLGRIVLTLLFLFIMTPFGWLLRLAGKDLLQLKRPENVDSYWKSSSDPGPLDRLF